MGKQTVAEEIFGRDQELALVSELLDAVPDVVRALVIEGVAGIGKSTLWRRAIEHASSASRHVLSSRPGERESELSYAALSDLLESIDEGTLASLPPPQRRALAVAMLREDVADPAVDPRAVAYAFLSSLKRLAKSQPVLIAIDDAQWLDEPTRRVLRFAMRRLEAERIAVLVMLRSANDSADPLGLDRSLAPARLDRLRLEPLTAGAIHHVVRSRLGANLPRSVLIQIHQVSQGNPFFAIEIARFLRSQGVTYEPGQRLPVPHRLIGSVEARLATLPDRTQSVLLTVAASPHPTVGLVTAVAEHPELVETDLSRAAAAGIVEMDGERIRFTHPLLAAAHYGAATDMQRRALHKRLATIVTDVEERAAHLAAGAPGPDSEVAGALERAGASARARGAPEVAATLAEQARRFTPAAEIEDLWRRTGEAAMCLYLSGESARARLLWEEIVAKAPRGPLRASALWRVLEFRDSTIDATTQLNAGAAALEEAGTDHALRAAIHHTLASTLTWGGNLGRAAPHASEALTFAELGHDPVALVMALNAAAWVEFLAGRGIPRALIGRAIALEDQIRHLPLENNPRMGLAMMLAYIGEDVAAARGEFAYLRHVGEESGFEVSMPLLLYAMSDLECRAGDWELAERYADESHEIATRTDQEFRVPLALCMKAMLAARRGQIDVARVVANEALAIATRSGPWITEARISAVLGFIEISAGSPETAHRWLGPVVASESAGGYAEPTLLHGLPDEIESLIALGDLAGAEALVETLEEQGRCLHRAWAQATGARCRGQLAAAQGDLALALSALDQALAEHERLPDPFELGRTLLVAGNVRRRARQKRPAREGLERAARLFAELGATAWAGRAGDELRRVGGHPTEPDQLSPTERRVATLVRQGKTNKEIARDLFVSVKSVEANLTRIYSKLRIRSRTELAVQSALLESEI
jgi:DNA-binding CsgD family transcriptional regulator